LFGAESDSEVCSFEDVCHVCGFSAYVCEIGPFLDGVVGCGFVGVGGRGFVWFYREGVIMEDVMYYVVLVGILCVVSCRTRVCCVGN